MPVRSVGCAALLASALLVGGALFPARAAEATAEQAAALETDLRAWLADTLGPMAALPERPVRLRAEGDHYQVEIPLDFLAAWGVKLDPGAAIESTLRPRDDGGWEFVVDRIPVPDAWALSMPTDGGDSAAPATIRQHFHVDGIDNHGIIDPALQRPTELHAALRGVRIESDVTAHDLASHQVAELGSETADLVIAPTPERRLDIAERAQVEDLSIHQSSSKTKAFDVRIEHARAGTEITGMPIERLREIFVAVSGLRDWVVRNVAALGTPGTIEPPPFDKADLERLMTLLRGTLGTVRLEDAADGIQIISEFGTVGLGHLGFELGADMRDEQMSAYADIGLDDLALPAAFADKAHGLVLRRFTIRPRISGISSTALGNLAAASVLDHTDPLPDMTTVFGPGGIQLIVEDAQIDLGVARAVGEGRMVVAPSGDFGGQATIRSVDFDALIAHLKSMPEAAMAVPMLQMARALAKPVGGTELLWQISVQNNSLLVNGIDPMKRGGKSKPNRP